MLSFTDVSKQYSKVRAVDRLTFSIEKGEIFALLGPNGAGKTTSIRMIMQIIQPDSGTIAFDPALTTEKGVDRTRLGYLPEERGLYQDATVLRSIVYLASLRGRDATWSRKKATEWLERFGLRDRALDKVSALSKGNQQKVQFIASILHEPDFVVLDEPFSGFDPINQELMSGVIRELRESGMTILLSAHQMQLVERIADRILLINSGRELISGTIDEIHQKTVSDLKILVRFTGDVDTSRLEALPLIRSFQPTENGYWELFLHETSSLNEVLAGLSSTGTITSLKTAEVSLHDIFIQSFTNGGQNHA